MIQPSRLEPGDEDRIVPNLTIAIPFHRRLDYLRDAIESVLDQRYSGWRLSVFDDGGSESGIADAVRSYVHGGIHYFRSDQNLGMVRAWNRCIDAAETEFVSLLHADDRLGPEYAGSMLELADRHPHATAYFCGATIIDSLGRPSFSFADAIKRFLIPRGGEDIELRGEAAVLALMRGNFIMCPTLCFRKSALGANRFSEDWVQVQDLELTTRLLMTGHSLVGTRRPAYVYRRHPEGATARQSENLLRFEEEFRLFERIAARAEERGWDAVARVSRRKAIVRLHLVYQIARDAVSLRPGRSLEKLRFLLGGR